MRLKVQVPAKVLLEQEAEKVLAKAENGLFCLLPHHIDFVSALVPGVLSYEDEEGRMNFVAVDEGILVKRGDEVQVSVRDGSIAADAEDARQAVKERFSAPGEDEGEIRSVIEKLEEEFISGYIKGK